MWNQSYKNRIYFTKSSKPNHWLCFCSLGDSVLMRRYTILWYKSSLLHYIIISIISISCKVSYYHFHQYQLHSILWSLLLVSVIQYLIISFISILLWLSLVSVAQYLINMIISSSCTGTFYQNHQYQLQSIWVSLSSVSAGQYLIIIIISVSCKVY